MLIDVVWVDLQPVNSTVVAICALWQSDFMGSAVWNVGFSALGRKNGVVKSKARHIQCISSVFWCILMYSIQFWCIIFSCIQCVISVSRVSRDCFRFSNLLHTFSVVVRGRRYVLQLQALLVFLLVITATRQTFLMSRIPRLTYLQSESIFQIQPRRDPRATVETLIFFLDIRPG